MSWIAVIFQMIIGQEYLTGNTGNLFFIYIYKYIIQELMILL